MNYVAPQPIELTESESELRSQIPSSPTNDGWHEIADAMEALVESLLARNAVPEVRLRLFCDPAYAETGHKSRQQIFESNGTSGKGIFRHPHFLPYLRHFINGPELPKDAIDGLCAILDADHGTSGMVMEQCRKHARVSVRNHGLSPSMAATEFFRLGIEIGMERRAARALRDAARSTR